jgi:hypothetical protein
MLTNVELGAATLKVANTTILIRPFSLSLRLITT